MSTHAKHSPSSLGYKETCPAFAGRFGSNPAADEGTRLHAALELDDDTDLTEEQLTLVTLCRDFHESELAKLDTPKQFRELRLTIAGGLTYGTADFVALSHDETHGFMIDWKFGRGAIEPANTNAQGAAYALGVFEKFPNLATLELHFVQPRRAWLSSHTYHRADVPNLTLRVQTIIRRANARNKQENPGAQCEYCRKQATCTALRQLALPIASRYQGLTIPEELHASNITDPRLMAHCLDVAKILKGWVESVNFHALEMALKGAEIPGYRLASRAGRRSITDVLAAYGSVRDSISLEDFLTCCTGVKLDALTETISADAPHGQKQKTKDDLISKLTGDGVITQAASSQYLKHI